ncbi:MAG TPA: MFS transporter [Sphingobacteriaceae bacterium]
MSSFLFSASFNMLIPELPAYLSSLGGAEYKGLIIGLFTVTAGISRPFSGKLTDTIGRVPVMAVGSLVCFVCGFLYPVLTSISGFLFLRLLHGFSTGFKPTATAAYIADVIPVGRWGEAMGIHGLCFSTGMAIGPAIGSAITARFSLDALFYCSSAFALLSIVILMNLKETLHGKQKFSAVHLKIGRGEIIERQALPAAIVTFLSYFGYGAIITLIPDWSDHLGMGNKGLFFMTFTIASLLIRVVAGKVSDRYGRVRMLKVSLGILVLSLVLIGLARSPAELLGASVVYGIGSGILSPAVSAWTADLSNPERRGMATATMYIALEAGIGLGALLAGSLFQDVYPMVPRIFFITAFVALLGLVYLRWIYRPVPVSPADRA